MFKKLKGYYVVLCRLAQNFIICNRDRFWDDFVYSISVNFVHYGYLELRV